MCVYFTIDFILSSVQKTYCHDFCYLQLFSFYHVVRTINARSEILVEMPVILAVCVELSVGYVLYAT
jgi:hypothetical protein